MRMSVQMNETSVQIRLAAATCLVLTNARADLVMNLVEMGEPAMVSYIALLN